MEIKKSVSFFLESRKNRDGRRPVAVNVFYNAEKVYLSTKLKIDPLFWGNNKAEGGTTPEQSQMLEKFNKELLLLELQITGIFDRAQILYARYPTPEELRNEYNTLQGKVQKDSQQDYQSRPFRQIVNEFISEMGVQNSWSTGTAPKYRIMCDHLEAFAKAKRIKITLASITEKTFEDFLRYMIATGDRNITVDNNMNYLRWIVSWAARKGYYTGKAHLNFSTRLKGLDASTREVIYLTWKQLMKMYQHKFKKGEEHLEATRDVFCFCCFTSLRHSDAQKLRRSDVRADHIQTITKKTDDRLEIELNDYSRAILNKYRLHLFPDNLALPYQSTVTVNRNIKIIGQILGFDEPRREVFYVGAERKEVVYPFYEMLSSHCGRRTFIVNAILRGIPIVVIMKWTGHADYESMKPYIAIVDELKRKSMNKFNDRRGSGRNTA